MTGPMRCGLGPGADGGRPAGAATHPTGAGPEPNSPSEPAGAAVAGREPDADQRRRAARTYAGQDRVGARPAAGRCAASAGTGTPLHLATQAVLKVRKGFQPLRVDCLAALKAVPEAAALQAGKGRFGTVQETAQAVCLRAVPRQRLSGRADICRVQEAVGLQLLLPQRGVGDLAAKGGRLLGESLAQALGFGRRDRAAWPINTHWLLSPPLGSL